MPTKNNTRAEKVRRDTVERWRSSGLSQAEFCRQEGIPEWRFSNWKCGQQRKDEKAKNHLPQRKTGRRDRGLEFAAIGEPSQSIVHRDTWSTAPFVPLVAPGLKQTSSGEMTIQLFFSRQAVQVVLSGANAETLRNLLSALMEFGG